MPDRVIASIRNREDKSGMVIQNIIDDFRSVIPVRIQSGAFIDQIGILDCITNEERGLCAS